MGSSGGFPSNFDKCAVMVFDNKDPQEMVFGPCVNEHVRISLAAWNAAHSAGKQLPIPRHGNGHKAESKRVPPEDRRKSERKCKSGVGYGNEKREFVRTGQY